MAALERIQRDKAHGLGCLRVDQHRPGGFAREQGQGVQRLQGAARAGDGAGYGVGLGRKALGELLCRVRLAQDVGAGGVVGLPQRGLGAGVTFRRDSCDFRACGRGRRVRNAGILSRTKWVSLIFRSILENKKSAEALFLFI